MWSDILRAVHGGASLHRGTMDRLRPVSGLYLPRSAETVYGLEVLSATDEKNSGFDINSIRQR